MIHRKFDLFRAVGKNRSAFLFGPRGSGKTWLCREFQKTQPATLEINLLGHELYRRYISEPGAFREDVLGALPKKGLLSVFVDEIQRLPELLNEVHWLLESYPGRVRFLLTGSSARKLKRGGANLLAGRALVLHLHPLCSDEGPFDLKQNIAFWFVAGDVRGHRSRGAAFFVCGAFI
jgi:predicted AAA+ superfamily ATPase